MTEDFSAEGGRRGKTAGKCNNLLFDSEGFNVITREGLCVDFISYRRSKHKQ